MNILPLHPKTEPRDRDEALTEAHELIEQACAAFRHVRLNGPCSHNQKAIYGALEQARSRLADEVAK